mmetsp:Transcript_5089/g.10328  ORF Transcript_5089/g.10328 Transcript_5089/m.10328 type:complete len:259 (-) Transcript_5089:268-1044(-)
MSGLWRQVKEGGIGFYMRHDWGPVGPVTTKKGPSNEDRLYFHGVAFNGRVFRVGETVTMDAGDDRPPYVALLLDFFYGPTLDGSHEMEPHLSARWFYRVEDVEVGDKVQVEPQEIFLGICDGDVEENHLETLLGKVTVLSEVDFAEVRDNRRTDTFLCRRTYDSSKRKLEVSSSRSIKKELSLTRVRGKGRIMRWTATIEMLDRILPIIAKMGEDELVLCVDRLGKVLENFREICESPKPSTKAELVQRMNSCFTGLV